MSDLLFDRKCRLLVAYTTPTSFTTLVQETKIEIDKLRITFKIKKDLKSKPNNATVSVYNLSATTRKALPSKGAKIILEAGYPETIEQIFIGDVRTLQSKLDSVNWVTEFECGDGERAKTNARVNKSFAGNTKVSDVLKTLGKEAGVNQGNLPEIAASQSGMYQNGLVSRGKTFNELEKVLDQSGYTVSIQNDALQVLKQGEVTKELVVVLDSGSGLIGSPELSSPDKKSGKSFVKVRSLLQPQIKPGRKIQLVSAQFNGFFKVLQVEHVGDTNSGDWFSDLELEVL